MSDHECPAEGCPRRVAYERLACPQHWYAVSKPTRDRVYRAYRAMRKTGIDDVETYRAHEAAIAAAIEEMNA